MRIEHQSITETLEDAYWENLSEDVGKIVLCAHMGRCEHFKVPEDLNPLLSAVNVLELGFETSIVCEALSCSIIHSELERFGELDAHFICNI